jgi:hypothetical protein
VVGFGPSPFAGSRIVERKRNPFYIICDVLQPQILFSVEHVALTTIILVEWRVLLLLLLLLLLSDGIIIK